MSESVKRLQQANLTTLHRTVAELSQAVIVERTGLSSTLVSRILSGKDSDEESGGALQRVLSILAACNLVVVPQSYRQVDPEVYRSLQVLALRAIRDEGPST